VRRFLLIYNFLSALSFSAILVLCLFSSPTCFFLRTSPITGGDLITRPPSSPFFTLSSLFTPNGSGRFFFCGHRYPFFMAIFIKTFRSIVLLPPFSTNGKAPPFGYENETTAPHPTREARFFSVKRPFLKKGQLLRDRDLQRRAGGGTFLTTKNSGGRSPPQPPSGKFFSCARLLSPLRGLWGISAVAGTAPLGPMDKMFSEGTFFLQEGLSLTTRFPAFLPMCLQPSIPSEFVFFPLESALFPGSQDIFASEN